MLIIGGSGSGKRNALPNVISHQLDIDKICLYAKDPSEAKYQLLTEKHEGAALRFCNGSRAFIKYSNDMDDTYENIEEYNPNKKRKILIVFDGMTADVLSNAKHQIVTELFIRGRRLNISLVFNTQSYFAIPKNIRLNSTLYFIMKIPIKRELQQVAINYSLDIDFKDFKNLYKKCTAKPYTSLTSDNSLRFRRNLLERI